MGGVAWKREGSRLGGGADWVTPIATYDSRAEAETAYGICHRRAVPYYSLLGQFSALTKLTLQARRNKKQQQQLYSSFRWSLV